MANGAQKVACDLASLGDKRYHNVHPPTPLLDAHLRLPIAPCSQATADVQRLVASTGLNTPPISNSSVRLTAEEPARDRCPVLSSSLSWEFEGPSGAADNAPHPIQHSRPFPCCVSLAQTCISMILLLLFFFWPLLSYVAGP